MPSPAGWGLGARGGVWWGAVGRPCKGLHLPLQKHRLSRCRRSATISVLVHTAAFYLFLSMVNGADSDFHIEDIGNVAMGSTSDHQ